jgi:hypothetical protein
MLYFQKYQGQVVNEQKCIDHAICVSNNFYIGESPFLFVENSNSVEKPKCEDEDEEQDRERCSEEMDPRHRGSGSSRSSVKQGPGAEQQNYKLEGKSNKNSVTLHL